ncbi:MAG: hypothetical protein HQK61_08050 [Desulfamplus sp.]|nr:hypothetical protein [Desulfamplus sp.]
MNKLFVILENDIQELEKAADILVYSHNKCICVDLMDGLNQDILESFEALTSRFARLSDMLIQKVLRTIDMIELESSGTVRDRINRAEKKKLIDSADSLIEIRVLRNEIAHEYKSETVYVIFEKVLHLTPLLLKAVDLTIEYSSKLLQSSD